MATGHGKDGGSLAVCGDGTLTVDNLRFEGDRGGILLTMEGGFDPAVPDRLNLLGAGGKGGVRPDLYRTRRG